MMLKVADHNQKRALLMFRTSLENFVFIIEFYPKVLLLKENLMTDYFIIYYHRHDYFFEPFNRQVTSLFEAGVIQRWIKSQFEDFDQLLFRPKEGPQIFGLDQLSIGFNIWLIALIVSFVGFWGERIFFLLSHLKLNIKSFREKMKIERKMKKKQNFATKNKKRNEKRKLKVVKKPVKKMKKESKLPPC